MIHLPTTNITREPADHLCDPINLRIFCCCEIIDYCYVRGTRGVLVNIVNHERSNPDKAGMGIQLISIPTYVFTYPIAWAGCDSRSIFK